MSPLRIVTLVVLASVIGPASRTRSSASSSPTSLRRSLRSSSTRPRRRSARRPRRPRRPPRGRRRPPRDPRRPPRAPLRPTTMTTTAGGRAADRVRRRLGAGPRSWQGPRRRRRLERQGQRRRGRRLASCRARGSGSWPGSSCCWSCPRSCRSSSSARSCWPGRPSVPTAPSPRRPRSCGRLAAEGSIRRPAAVRRRPGGDVRGLPGSERPVEAETNLTFVPPRAPTARAQASRPDRPSSSRSARSRRANDPAGGRATSPVGRVGYVAVPSAGGRGSAGCSSRLPSDFERSAARGGGRRSRARRPA